MKRFSLSAALLSTAVLFVACNGIEKAGFNTESVLVGRTADVARSVNVSQSEAAGIADMFLRTDAGSNRYNRKNIYVSKPNNHQ